MRRMPPSTKVYLERDKMEADFDTNMTAMSLLPVKDLAELIDKEIKAENWLAVGIASCQMVKRYAAINQMASQKIIQSIRNMKKDDKS